MNQLTSSFSSLHFAEAAMRLQNIVNYTPLQLNASLSAKYQCNVYLKREDLQIVRSYKLRGAYNMISLLPPDQLAKGVVCASAGNHAQGFAYSCKKLGVKGVVFMPIITPKQKVKQTRMFGEGNIEIRLVGDTYDDCSVAAQLFTRENKMTFIPPFDDPRIIEGQGTVAVEIVAEKSDIDLCICTCRWRRISSRRWQLLQNVFPENKNNRSGTTRSTFHV